MKFLKNKKQNLPLNDTEPTQLLVLKELTGNRYIEFDGTTDGFALAGLEILRERNQSADLYPTREQLKLDMEKSLKKLEEMYGTTDPESTKDLPGTEGIAALANHFRKVEMISELEKATEKDLEFIDDLESILNYSVEDIQSNLELQDYVVNMVQYLLHLRKEYEGEDFEIIDSLEQN